ncbi:MAG TPA: RNA polymerase sigma factor [Opitutus sp.]|nr:RNA polymerase sigma factor [Opitutus sp.]
MSPPPQDEAPSSQHIRWFADEVQPHGASLRSYLRKAFPRALDVDDVVQESYLRIWQVCTSRSIRSARGLLFTIARHLALDLVRREKRSPIDAVEDLSALPITDEAPSVGNALGHQEKIQLLAEAIDQLPARCREVVIMRKLQQISQKEVAARLGLAEKSVEAQLARGVKRCEQYLIRRGVRSCYHDESV